MYPEPTMQKATTTLRYIRYAEILGTIAFLAGHVLYWTYADVKLQKDLRIVRTFCLQKYGPGTDGNYQVGENGTLVPFCANKTGVYIATL